MEATDYSVGISYVDGFLNQMLNDILNILNPRIMEVYSEILLPPTPISPLNEKLLMEKAMRQQIKKVLEDYKIISIYGNLQTLPDIRPADAKKLESLKKRRRYNIDHVVSDYNKEKSAYFEGVKISNGVTPFTEIEKKYIRKERNAVIEANDRDLDSWSGKQKDRGNDECIYFCDYPNIRYYITKLNKFEKFFWLDLETCITRYSKTDEFLRYVQIRTFSGDDAGLYRKPGKSVQEFEEINEDLTARLEEKPGGYIAIADIKRTLDGMETNGLKIISPTPFMLDRKGSDLIGYLVGKCWTTYHATGEFSATGTINELLKIMYPNTKKPGQSQYDTVLSYLANIQNISLLGKTGTTSLGKSGIFDNVEFDYGQNNNENGVGRSYQVTLGQTFTKDLLNMRFSTIINTIVERLDNDVSKLLYQDIKKDRLYDVMNGKMEHSYTLEALEHKVRVVGKKNERPKIYAAALKELIKNRVLVASYEIASGNIFKIIWSDLSEIEHRDVMTFDIGKNEIIALKSELY